MITKDDLAKYKGFKTLVQRTKIEVQGEAVIMAANLMQWFYQLEQKLELIEKKYTQEAELAIVKEKESSIKEEKKGK